MLISSNSAAMFNWFQAAFLTVETLEKPIESAEDLAEQVQSYSPYYRPVELSQTLSYIHWRVPDITY